MIDDVDCQKTANSRMTFPWYNVCSITLTDFLSSHRAERPSFSIRKECQLLFFIILKILFAFLMLYQSLSDYQRAV